MGIKKRIFVCSIFQESNSFNPISSPKSMFSIIEHEALKSHTSFNTSMSGTINYLQGLDDVEIIYGIQMRACSGAPLKSDVAEYFLDRTLADIKTAGKLDGIIINFHGATMAENSDDVCGDVLEKIREAVGEKMPISAAFDFHANITEKLMKNADYICGFHEYPHIDQKETGIRASKLLIDHLNGKKAKTARVTIPMIAPAHGYTTTSGKLLELVNKAKAMVSSGRIIDYTVFEVQPWLDAKEMAASVIVIAENEDTAKIAALEIAKENFNIRKELLGSPLTSIEQVIEKAIKNTSGKPIILVDSSDSRGAGSTADSAAVIEALIPYRKTLSAAVGVSDAPAAKRAFELGVGAVSDFTLGATVSPELSNPVVVKDALVSSLHEGHFTLMSPISKGAVTFCGKTAVLKADKMLILVSENSRAEGDVGYFRSFGIIPEMCDIVSVKACTSFRAGYEPIAAEICNTATPGAAGTVLTDLPYKKRPVPLYPFEEITEADISEAKCYR